MKFQDKFFFACNRSVRVDRVSDRIENSRPSTLLGINSALKFCFFLFRKSLWAVLDTPHKVRLLELSGYSKKFLITRLSAEALAKAGN